MLRFHNVTIDGWCQHKKLHLEFDAAATAVIGPNGSGKSNAINAGYTLLTGKAVVGKLEDNLHWEAETATLSGLFSFNGRPFLVTRSFSAPFVIDDTGAKVGRKEVSKRAVLDFSPGVPKSKKKKEDLVIGISDVNDAITSLLDIPVSVLGNHVFVPQTDGSKALYLPESERVDAFTKLLPAVNVVGPRLEAVTRELSRFGEILIATPSVDLERAVTAALAEVKAAEKAASRAENEMQAFDTEGANKVLADHARAGEARRGMNLLRKSLADAKQKKDTADEKLQESKDRVTELRDGLREAREEYRAAQESVGRLQEVVRKREKVAALREELRELGDPPEPFTEKQPVSEEELAKLEKKAQEARAEAAKLDGSAAQIRKFKGECPVCHSKFPGWEKALAEVTAQLEEVTPELNNLESSLARNRSSLKNWEKAKADRERACREHEHEHRRILSALEAAGSPGSEDPTAALAAARDTIGAYKEVEEALSENETILETRENAAKTAAEAYQSLQDRANEFSSALANAPSQEDVETATDALERYQKALVAHGEARGALTAAQRRLRESEENLENTRRLEAKVANVASYRKLLEEARAVLHRDKLPRIVTQMYLARLNKLCAKYMEAFDAPFAVRVLENLDIECFHPNGYASLATRLSGGQKCVLSTVFRFATNRLFADKLGLLVLDEPTEFMDKDNVASMGDLIRSIRAESLASNMQTIVITHAEQLVSSFDRVIAIGKPETEGD